MIKYTYELNEEIARWSTEIYIKKHPEFNWWIAFTNPTAGPWKKIVAPNGSGTYVEIYRFTREEERPDLILVNDVLKIILIIEAKDYVGKLTTKDQMEKSIRVIADVSKILKNASIEHWNKRKEYKIVSSFLWMCEKKEKVIEESNLVQKSLDKYNSLGIDNKLLNVIVCKDAEDNLENSFIYNGKEYSDMGSVGPSLG